MLILWCWIAAAALVASVAVHVATFTGVDPESTFPGVLLPHAALLPLCLATLCYGFRHRGRGSALPWSWIVTGLLAGYMFVNLAIVTILREGGEAEDRDGKYVLHSRGTVLRELDEAEYHQQRAYAVRGYTGFEVFFSFVALTELVGAARRRRRVAEAPAPLPLPPRVDDGVLPAEEEPDVVSPGPAIEPEPPRQPAGVLAGLAWLLAYVACVGLILTCRPVFGAAAVPPVVAAMVLAALHRRSSPYLDIIGSNFGIVVFMLNGLLAIGMSKLASEFTYVTVYAGPRAASSGGVRIASPGEGPRQLSNGEEVHGRVWTAMHLFIEYPLSFVGIIGINYLAYRASGLFARRRRTREAGPLPDDQGGALPERAAER